MKYNTSATSTSKASAAIANSPASSESPLPAGGVAGIVAAVLPLTVAGPTLVTSVTLWASCTRVVRTGAGPGVATRRGDPRAGGFSGTGVLAPVVMPLVPCPNPVTAGVTGPGRELDEKPPNPAAFVGKEKTPVGGAADGEGAAKCEVVVVVVVVVVVNMLLPPLPASPHAVRDRTVGPPAWSALGAVRRRLGGPLALALRGRLGRMAGWTTR